jgi:hypothetical protein
MLQAVDEGPFGKPIFGKGVQAVHRIDHHGDSGRSRWQPPVDPRLGLCVWTIAGDSDRPGAEIPMTSKAGGGEGA